MFSKLKHKKLKHTVTNICMWLSSFLVGIWFICAVTTGFGYVFI
jgi:hypothetical protein